MSKLEKREDDEEEEEEESSDDDEEEEGADDDDDDDDDGEEEEEEDLQVDTDGRTVIGGEMDYETRCFDRALHLSGDTEVTALFKQCELAFTARATGTDEYSAGTTFWVGADSKPRTALERLAQQIFEFHTATAVFDPARSGAEWWTQCIDPDDDIALHWDRDYDMQVRRAGRCHLCRRRSATDTAAARPYATNAPERRPLV